MAPRFRQKADFERGLEVIENRSESLNRFLQAYRQLMGLPAPKLAAVSLAPLVHRVAQLERRVSVAVIGGADIVIQADADHIEQALINLVRNAADAALSPDAVSDSEAHVEITWQTTGSEVAIAVLDNGPGLTNADNLFVPFYTTKPGGTGIGLVLARRSPWPIADRSNSPTAPTALQAAGRNSGCHSSNQPPRRMTRLKQRSAKTYTRRAKYLKDTNEVSDDL